MPTLKIQKADGTFEFLQLAGEEFADIGNQVLGVKSQLNHTGQDLEGRGINVMFPPTPLIGAKGDNIADDSDKILNIINTLKDGDTIIFPNSLGYRTTKKITIPRGINVLMDSPIIYDGPGGETALEIGEVSSANFHREMRIRVRRKSVSDWEDERDIGVIILNANSCNISMFESRNFTIGVQFLGNGQGFSYNEVKLLYLVSNKYGIDLNNINNGWTNENSFYGGRFTVFSGVNRDKSRIGIVIRGSYENNNNNLFIKPSFELNQVNMTAGEALPILIENGMQNEFLSCRNEGNGSIFARILNNSAENMIDIGYGIGKIEDLSNIPTSVIKIRRNKVKDNCKQLVYQSCALHKNAVQYNSNESWFNIKNVMGVVSTNASTFLYTSNAVLHSNFIELGLGRGLGIYADVSIEKELKVTKDVELDGLGRVYVRCYDANGALLADDKPYVTGRQGEGLTYYSTQYGGSWGRGSDHASETFLKFHVDVKKVLIMVVSGAQKCRIRSFSIYSSGSNSTLSVTAWSDFEQFQNDNVAVQPPTIGTNLVGKVIKNASPSASGHLGWVCVSSGTPGTWKGFGAIQA